jgi:hypothetical protein
VEMPMVILFGKSGLKTGLNPVWVTIQPGGEMNEKPQVFFVFFSYFLDRINIINRTGKRLFCTP